MKTSWEFYTIFCCVTWIVVSFIAATSADANHSSKFHGRGQFKSITTSTNRNGNEHYPGELIFEETFETLDKKIWLHEIAMAGRSNGEFQMYDSDPQNSYVRDGHLHITPSFTADKYGIDVVNNGTMDLGDRCTENSISACSYNSSTGDILNPIVSARINTRNSFGFRYGVVEVRAKIPAGDWQWPAIWLMPQNNTYGLWPMSGEIDIMEARSNRELFTTSGRDIGSNEVGATLHFGLNRTTDRWRLTHFTRQNKNGFNSNFHTYGVVWTPDYIIFTLDGIAVGTIAPPEGGFWDLGQFEGDKIWSDDKMSPFDEKFYIILNVAVGGTSGYFPDNTGPKRKPWRNSSEHAKLDFWNARNEWKPTWTEDNGSFIVDYVRVWAL